MQFVAITLVSVVLVLAVAAALQTARMTGKLGLAAGITLALFSVFELIVFSLMASVVQKCEEEVARSTCCDNNYNGIYHKRSRF